MELTGDHNLQLAACLGFNGSTITGSGGQLIGWLAGTVIIDRFASHEDVFSILRGEADAGALYSLSAATVDAPIFNQTLVPTHLEQRPIIKQFHKSTSCSVPSPNDLVYWGIPKSASVTAMAWIQLIDAPKQKEACILSHGSWEKGWKLSM